MRVIGKAKLDEFAQQHADARSQVEAWIGLVEGTEWEDPMDVKVHFPSASFLGDSRIVFNIKGNRYRLYVKIAYQSKTILVKEIGTHAEYEKWDFS